MERDNYMVIAKDTNMGDVEVWYGDYEDCECFYEANDGYLNGAWLEIVSDKELNDILDECDSLV